MCLDRLDAQKQLGRDGAVAPPAGGQLADLALARSERSGTCEGGAAGTQTRSDEPAPGLLGQRQRAGAIRVGQCGPERVAGLDPASCPDERTAQLEPQTGALEQGRWVCEPGERASA